MDNLLSTRQAAELLGLTDATIGRYVKALTRGVHYVQPNSKVRRFHAAELLNWFENMSDPAAHAVWLEARSVEAGMGRSCSPKESRTANSGMGRSRR